MSDNLYLKHNYLDKERKCLIGIPIRVYDMKSGGYSILKRNKVFNKDEIEVLDKMSKFERNYYIGKLTREKNLTKILMDGFIDARKRFMYYNDIIDDDILSIKKDAFFLVNRPASKLKFDGYDFKVEEIYSSYYYLNDKEFYFSNNKFKIDVKGINDELLEKHREFFLDDLCNIFRINEGRDLNYRNKFIVNYRKSYLTRDLDIGCYRELNEDSCFRYKNIIGGQSYLIEEFDDINLIDISYNYIKYLLPLFNLLF